MHLKNKTVYIEKWVYNKPKLMPNQDGNIILISKGCFGPVEVYEWGIDANKQAYERYECSRMIFIKAITIGLP